MKKYGDQIRLARNKKNITQKQLAKKCGLTANYIEQIENNKRIINESIADKIFKVLEMKDELLSQEAISKKEDKVEKKYKPKIEKKVTHNKIDHTASWSGALDNLIRKYPVYDIKSKKIIKNKQLPALEKKIDGYNCDKLSFVSISDNEMEEFGIVKDDIVMIYLTKDITNDKIYYFEKENKPFVRKLRKEQNNKLVISYNHNPSDIEIVELDKIKIIGRCVKIERYI